MTEGEVLDNFLKTAPKDKKMIFVCRTGSRSENILEKAIKMGFKNAKHLEGGMRAYRTL